MAKDDFNMDFDFEDEYGFDPDSFLGDEDSEDIDFSEFGGETFGDPVPGGSGDDFDDFNLDDLDLGDLELSGDSGLEGLGLEDDPDLKDLDFGEAEFDLGDLGQDEFGLGDLG